MTGGRNHAPLRMACIGEAMVELALDTGGNTARLGFAGDTLNTAIYLRRALDPKHSVGFVSVIGQDDLSDRMLAMIRTEGLGTDLVLRHADRTVGLYSISTDAAGERSFAYWRDHSAARTLFQTGEGVAFDSLNGFDVLYLSAITLAILPRSVRQGLLTWLARFRQRGGTVAFDSNYRPRLWPVLTEAQAAVTAAWQVCDIGLPSLDDEMALFGDSDAAAVLARLRGFGVRSGALKCGALGPRPLDPASLCPDAFPPAPRVVDTTAAGDSFNAGYLAAILTGGNEVAALQQGHAFASQVIGYPGAIVSQRDWRHTTLSGNGPA